MQQRQDSVGAICNYGMGIFIYVFDSFFEGGGALTIVVFSVFVHMRNATYIMFNMLSSISG